MAKYKEETATVYRRAEMIIINNPLPSSGLNPSMRFNEETAMIHADETVTSQGPVPNSWLVEELTSDNLNEEFNVVDSNDKITGRATFGDVHAMLRSLYKYVATKRDNAPPPNDPAVGNPEGVEFVIDNPPTE